MSCVRHFGAEKAREVARRTGRGPHPYVTGFGMGGDEAGFPPADFADAFAIAREAGSASRSTPGEWAGPESVRGGLALGVSRIGHGVRASEDPDSCANSPSGARCSRCVRPATSCSASTRATRASAARPARGRGARDARLRRPALLGRVDRRGVRGRRRAVRLDDERCGRSRGPRSMRPSWRRTSGRPSSVGLVCGRLNPASLRRDRIVRLTLTRLMVVALLVLGMGVVAACGDD
jgi:hypothetical protein